MREDRGLTSDEAAPKGIAQARLLLLVLTGRRGLVRAVVRDVFTLDHRRDGYPACGLDDQIAAVFDRIGINIGQWAQVFFRVVSAPIGRSGLGG